MPTPSAQRLSQTEYLTDGVTTVWNFSFSGGYILSSHVKAYTENIATGLRTEIVVTAPMLIGPFQIQITPVLAVGSKLVIYRDTPKDLPLVDFTDESGFSEVSLDTNAKQAVFVAAETQDLVNTSTNYDAEQAAIAALAAASAAVAAANSALVSANAAAASAGIISIPLPVASGGTGGTDAASARSSISSAKSGANSDITSLSALSTALSKTQGGTGNSTGSGLAETGDIKFWPTAAAPSGWLKCDGSLVSTTTYAALHGVIGYTYGGSGAVFALPNATDRMLVGAGGLYPVAGTGGSKDAVVVGHSHTATSTDSGHVHSEIGGLILVGGGSFSGVASSSTSSGTGYANITTTVNSTGVSGSGANMSPYLAVTVLIKA